MSEVPIVPRYPQKTRRGPHEVMKANIIKPFQMVLYGSGNVSTRCSKGSYSVRLHNLLCVGSVARMGTPTQTLGGELRTTPSQINYYRLGVVRSSPPRVGVGVPILPTPPTAGIAHHKPLPAPTPPPPLGYSGPECIQTYVVECCAATFCRHAVDNQCNVTLARNAPLIFSLLKKNWVSKG